MRTGVKNSFINRDIFALAFLAAVSVRGAKFPLRHIDVFFVAKSRDLKWRTGALLLLPELCGEGGRQIYM